MRGERYEVFIGRKGGSEHGLGRREAGVGRKEEREKVKENVGGKKKRGAEKGIGWPLTKERIGERRNGRKER